MRKSFKQTSTSQYLVTAESQPNISILVKIEEGKTGVYARQAVLPLFKAVESSLTRADLSARKVKN